MDKYADEMRINKLDILNKKWLLKIEKLCMTESLVIKWIN